MSDSKVPNVSSRDDYIERHNIKALTAEWIERLGSDQPEDPWKALLQFIEEYHNDSAAFVVCENDWCGVKMPVEEYEEHLKICSPDRWNKCLRCDQRVEVSKMAQHRLNCHMRNCPHCGEYVLPRMLKLCPHVILKQLSSRAMTQELQRASSMKNASRSEQKVKHLQRLWRTTTAQRNFRRLAFKVVWNMMDSAREMKLAHGLGYTSSASSHSMMQWGSRGAGSVARLGAGSVEMTLAEQESRIKACHPVEDLQQVLATIEQGEVVEFTEAQDIIQDAAKILACRPTVVNVATPYNGEVVIVGDLHGQLKDLLYILKTEGLPSENKRYIFNGDFVDRGPHGCEVLILIFAMLCTFPESVFVNRGNHEDYKTNKEYGFLVEIRAKYEDDSEEVYDDMLKAFKVMPLVHVLDKRVMIVHGGLPREVGPIERINNIGHIRHIPTVEQVDDDEEIMADLVWSDPVERFKSRCIGLRHQGQYWRTSARGCGVEYLAEHTKQYLEANNLEMVVRSHEMVAAGYESCHEGRCFTVFSASDYCGVSGNRAAICVFAYMQNDPVFRTWYLKDGIHIAELDADSSHSGETTLPQDKKHPDAECIDCLRQIRELIWQHRYKLMTNFSTADPEQTGYVAKVEWCEIMRKTLELDIKWYFLAHYLADIILYCEIPSVRYTQFLTSIESKCSSMFLNSWLQHKIPDVFSRLELPDDFVPSNPVFVRQQQRRRSSQLLNSNNSPVARPLSPLAPKDIDSAETSVKSADGTGKPPLPNPPSSGASVRFARGVLTPTGIVDEAQTKVPADWASIKVGFNYFVSNLRSKSVVAAKMEDNELFVLFTKFDRNLDGHVLIGEVVDDVKKSRDRKRAEKGGDGSDSDESSIMSGSDDSEEAVVMDLGELSLDSLTGKPKDESQKKDEARKAVQSVKDQIVITRVEKCREEWMYSSMHLLQKFFLYGRTRGLEASFHLLDRDHNGVIDYDEFRKVLRHLNNSLPTPLKETQMAEMFKVIDADRSGEVDLQEFLRYFSVVDMRNSYGAGSRSFNPDSIAATPAQSSMVLKKRNEVRAGSEQPPAVSVE